MEFLMSSDAIICLITGAILGGLSGQVLRGLGLIGNVVVGLVGGVLGGVVFDAIDVMNVGDIADPIIAGAVGALVLLGIVGLVKR